MGSSTRIAASSLGLVVLVVGFWLLFLGPARQQNSDLGEEASQLQISLAESKSQAREARRARRKFPANYQQLVILGKAVPGGDETSSLLVQLSQVAKRSHVQFDSIKLSAAEEQVASPEAAAPSPSSSSEPTPPTEAAAALLPLGASIGTAGLGVMPYSLTFKGDFFHVADFMQGIDALVEIKKGSHVAVDGRLMTLDGFTLTPDSEDSSSLQANFSVTTYLVPPSQGITAGASPTGPAASVPAATGSEEPATTPTTASTATEGAQ